MRNLPYSYSNADFSAEFKRKNLPIPIGISRTNDLKKRSTRQVHFKTTREADIAWAWFHKLKLKINNYDFTIRNCPKVYDTKTGQNKVRNEMIAENLVIRITTTNSDFFDWSDLDAELIRTSQPEGTGVFISDFFVEKSSQTKLDKFLEDFQKLEMTDTSIYLFSVADGNSFEKRTFYVGMHSLVTDSTITTILKNLNSSDRTDSKILTEVTTKPDFDLPDVFKMKRLVYKIPSSNGFFAFSSEREAVQLYTKLRGTNPIGSDGTNGLYYYGHHAGNKDKVNSTIFLTVNRNYKNVERLWKEEKVRISENDWMNKYRIISDFARGVKLSQYKKLGNGKVEVLDFEETDEEIGQNGQIPGCKFIRPKFKNKKLIGVDLEFQDFLHADYFFTYSDKILPTNSGDAFDDNFFHCRPILTVWRSPNTKRLKAQQTLEKKYDVKEAGEGTPFNEYFG